MMPRSEAVIFDMDGLVLDTEPLYRQVWLGAADQLGYVPDKRLYPLFLGRSSRDCEEILQRHFGDDFPVDEFGRLWRQRWRRLLAVEPVAVLPGAEELLQELEGHEVPFALATTANARETEESLKAAGMNGRFPIVVTVDDVARGKPAPDLFLEAARRLAVAPGRCVVLEDSDAGIQAAAAAGMPAIMVPISHTPSEEIRQAAYQIVPSLREARPLLRELLGLDPPR
jgi:HAD superfamily hydrolase (TIGR01509 family)